MYLKRLFKTVVLKAFLWRRRKKINWNLKAWNSITKHRFQDWRLMEYLQELGVDTLSSVAAIIDSRFPEFQELDLWPRRTPQDMTGTLEVDVLYSILELLILPWVKKQMTHQALPPALLLGTWRPKFLSRPSVQTDNTPSKVNYVRASWLLNVHLDPPMTFLLLLHQPTDLVLGFLSVVIPTTVLLKKTPFQWTTVTQEAFSHHDVWPLPPLLSYSVQIQHSPL